jgi:putative tryptophan/tyrosine transport system substrate-binding protein
MDSICSPKVPRRAFMAALAGSLLAAPLAAEAQPGKVWRIGYIDVSDDVKRYEAISRRLRELGYVEGRNLITTRRYSEGRAERFPEFAAELVRLKVDIIIVITTPAALAVKGATKTIPIVFPTAIDPVGAGVISSLARPGGNITGLTTQSPDLIAKRLQLFKEAIPHLSRVAAIWNAGNPANAGPWREAQEAARALGVALLSQEVRGPADFERAFAVMARERPDGLLFIRDGLTLQHGEQIVDFVTRKAIPSMFEGSELAAAGGLMSYEANLADLLRRGAILVDKILKGAKPGDLPFERPTTFELVINLKTAKALGLTIPPSLLQRADQVIE